MSEFTPGPWLIDGRTVYALQDSVWMGIPSKENRWFAGVQGPKCPENELKANAKLIAAAPELYEALKSIHDALKTNSLTPEHQNEALKALSKATD